MNSNDIILAARECIDTPFQHQGRIVGKALDCVGVVIHVAKRLGLEIFEPAAYGRAPHQGMLELLADQQTDLERVQDRQPGDILMMRFAQEPQHVGIFTGENIIHAYENIKKVCEHRLSSVWAARIVRVYRFKGLDK